MKKEKVNSQLERGLPRIIAPRRGGARSVRGFTLIEILVAMVLMVMLAGALLTLQYILSQNQIVVWRNYISINEASNSLSTLVREARAARNGENGAFAIETADDSELSFYSDYDFDGQAEKVRYFLSGSNFSKGVIEPSGFPVSYPEAQEKVKVLSENVRNGNIPLFYYYNSDWPSDTSGNPLSTPASPSDVKLIKIFIRLNTSPGKPDKDYLLESNSQIRMLKENL